MTLRGQIIDTHDNAAMIQAVLAGDPQAFTPLVHRYFSMVYAIALAGLGQREAAEDLAQEVFVRAYLGLAQLKNPVAFPAWLGRIARNMTTDWQRRGQRTSTFLPLIHKDSTPREVADQRLIPADRQMEMNESHASLCEALRRLPREQREAVLLYYMEEVGQSEIARMLGVSQAKVSRLLKSALAAMRGLMEERMRQDLGQMRAPARAKAGTVGLVAATAALPLAAKASLAAASAGALQALTASAGTQVGGSLISAKLATWIKAVKLFYTTGGKTMIAIKSLATLMGTVAMIAVGVQLTTAEDAPVAQATLPPGARVLHFPKDRTLGRISIDAQHFNNTYYKSIENGASWDEYEWQYLGEARGDVVIPAGKVVRLDIVPPQVFEDLSPLAKLGPDDIHHLFIAHTYAQSAPAGFNPDSLMAPLAGLTGLKVLDIGATKISARGLQVLHNFTALERLHTPEGLTDEGMAIISELKSLKGLYGYGSAVTQTGLTRLSQLGALEELTLVRMGVDDAGLAPLASIPSLKRLELGGDRITDRGMAVVSRIPSLKSLILNGTDIGDQGVALLATSPSIEDLKLHHCDQITDDGVASLRPMRSLKSIDLWTANALTDRAAEALSEIKTLESVELWADNMSDQALFALARLPRLKCAKLCVTYNSDPTDPDYSRIRFSEGGLAALAAAAPTLRELQVGGYGINDEALAQIAKMPNLTELQIFPLLTATNAGLGQLSALKQLERLSIHNASDAVTVAAFKQMGELSQIKAIQAKGIVQDNSGLDLSGMPNLEGLTFHLRTCQSLRDEDLVTLSGLKHLKRLHLGTNHELLTDAGLAHFAGLTSLTTNLIIGSARFTDEGMRYLTGMQNLNRLYIRGNIGDAGLNQIAKLRALTSLTVNTSALYSPEGMNQIQAGLPFLTSFEIGPDRILMAGMPQLPQPGEDVPDMTVTTLDGQQLQLSKINKIIMLHFWATWDQRSLADLAKLKEVNARLSARYPGRFMLLSLALDNNDADWRDCIQREGMDWTQARLPLECMRVYRYGLKVLPAYFLLTADGKVLINPAGSWKDLDTIIEQVMVGTQ